MTGRQRPSRFRLLATPAAALLAGCVLSVACTAARAAYEVRIEAPRPLRDLLERHLDLARYQDRKDITDDQLQYMVETIGEQVTKLTATEGYFVPKATAQLEGPPERRTVRVKVEAGPRTTIDSVALDFTGAIAQEPKRIDALKKAWGLPQGAPFRQSGWDKAKEDSLAACRASATTRPGRRHRRRASTPTRTRPICRSPTTAGRPTRWGRWMCRACRAIRAASSTM